VSKPLHIVLIGAGNVAHHIAESFAKNAEATLVQVFNHRLTKQAKDFAGSFHVPIVSTYNKLEKNADIYILCVKDSALPEVAAELSALKLQGIVLHTSGSVDMDVLKRASHKTGVYYPLQTFSKNSPVDWKRTPILVEANSAATLKQITKIAASVSKTVKAVDSETRLKLHLAAVFACNFTNALYAAAFDYVGENLNTKDAELLWPIMLSSFNKVIYNSQPKQAQTGPAMRNDKTVMDKHLALLKNDKQLAAVYKLISELILSQQNKL
jgi:predicted short-subunit dehydrogenase-like oxidoreductase (DUF2520 family)